MSPTPSPARQTRRTTALVLAASALSLTAFAAGPRLLRAFGRGAAPADAPRGLCGGGAPPRANATFDRGHLAAALSGSTLAGAAGPAYLSVDLTTAASADVGARPPLDLALVIDRSGSMAGEKLVAAKRAASSIVARLDARDRVALVEYDSTADVLVPLARLDEAGRRRLNEAISAIVERGGTNLHGGMVLGLEQVARSASVGRLNRVVLLSDGQANEGITDNGALGQIAGQAADRGVRLTTVGVGVDYNEDLMEILAERGRGRYHYVKDASSLESVFAAELGELKGTVATGAEIRLEPTCAGVVVEDVLGYDVRREGAAVIVPLADLPASDARRLVARVRVPGGSASASELVRVALTYTDARSKAASRTAVTLGAALSDDVTLAEKTAHPDVMAHVVQMEGAAAVRAATAAWERGDRAGARAHLSRRQNELVGLANRYNVAPEKAAQAMQAMPELDNQIAQYEADSFSGKAARKLHKLAAKSQFKAKW